MKHIEQRSLHQQLSELRKLTVYFALQKFSSYNKKDTVVSETHLDVGPLGAWKAQSLWQLPVQREAAHELGG